MVKLRNCVNYNFFVVFYSNGHYELIHCNTLREAKQVAKSLFEHNVEDIHIIEVANCWIVEGGPYGFME